MSLFSKIFGFNKNAKKNSKESEVILMISNVLEGILSISQLNFSFDVEVDEKNGIFVELFGKDQELLIEKDGKLLDAFQLYLKRVIQCRFPEERITLVVDCDDFREKMDQSLIDLADKLKKVVLKKSKSVYFRSLSPRDRRIVHQYLSEDERIYSHSIGEGLYKRIKISPNSQNNTTV